MKKILSVVASLAILANSLLYPFSYVYAQEETSTPEPTPIVEEIVTPSPEPTVEPSATPEITPTPDVTPTATPTTTPEITPTPSPSPWTFEKVELNKEYQKGGVTLTFTKLPDPSGNIKIEEITLTEEQIKQTGSLSNKAYDITSDMENGTFEYTLTLPTTTTNNVEVKASEDGQTFVTVGGVSAQTDTLTVIGLNHFTIFVITGTINEAPIPDEGVPFTEGSDTVIINEILYRPSSGNEWIELYNNSNSPVLLTGWRLSDGNTVTTDDIDLSGTIPAHGIIVFEHANLWLNDDGDTATLKNDTGTIISQITFKDAGATAVVGTANVGEVDSGQSIGRTTDGNGNPTAWQVFTTPTKGWFNDTSGGAPTWNTISSQFCNPVPGPCAVGIASNITSADDPSSITGLYFEKTGLGKISLSNTINMTDQDIVAKLQNLGTAMDMSDGHIEFDSTTASAMDAAGATLYMYGLTDFNAIPNLIVKNDADTVIQPGTDDYPTIVKIWDNTAKTLTFTTSHFTQFDIEYPVTNETTGVKYATIQAAINAASPSATINVAAGTYNESQILINKPLTLQGAGYATTIIDGGGTSTGGLVKITASSGTVTLSGFTIKNTNNSDDLGHGINVDNGGVSSVDVKILNNAIKNVGPVGIRVNDANSVQIEGNNISELYSAVTPHVIPNGIQIGYLNGDSTSPALGITGTIDSNEISDCYWMDGDVATGDYETGNEGGAGLLIMDTAADLEISNNNIYDNGVGIDIEAGPSTKIENNNIYDNAYGVVSWNANQSINENKIENNSQSGIYRTSWGDTSGTVDATENWWGSSDPTVVQASTSGNITFRPYYTDSGKTILSPTAPGTPTTVSTSPTNNTTPTWNWTSSIDADHYIFYWSTVLGGTTFNSGNINGNSYIHTNPLTNSIWYSKVLAYDPDGNSSSFSGNSSPLTIDTVAPTVVLTDDHSDSLVRDADAVVITATFTEADQVNEITPPTISIHSNPYLVDNGLMTSINNLIWTYMWDVPTGNDGTHTVSIKAKDRAGNSNDLATGQTSYTIDNTSPTVTILGGGESDYSLPDLLGDGRFGTTLIFNEELNAESKTAVENALNTGADKTLTFRWGSGDISNKLRISVTNTVTATFANDVIVNVSDIAGNTTSSLLLVDSKLSDTQISPDSDGEATADSDNPEVVITDPDQEVTVTVDGTTEATIDVSSFVDGGTGDIPQININSSTANITIPATTVTGPEGWDGVIAAPTVTTVDLPVVSGETSTLGTAIEIGFATDKLSFDNAVRILLPGQAGKRAGYSRPGTAFTEITNTCSADNQAAGDALPADGECKIDVGSDLVIWTKHFTKFAAYTQTTNSTSGGGTTTASAPVCNDTKPGSAPSGLIAVAGFNSVTLSWNKANDPVSYYLITYGTSSGSQTYGNPNIGGSSTTSYTITNLSGGVRYYFKVRAGNGCAPGDYSNEASVTPSGGFVEGVAPGFEAGVLGESTEQNLDSTSTETDNSTPTPEVKGTDTSNWNARNIALISFGSALAILALLLLWRKKKTS